MLDISFAELCIVLFVAVIFISPKKFPTLFKAMANFISPKKFPTLFKAMAKLYKKAKSSLLGIKEEIEREDKFQELKKIENEFKILKNEVKKTTKKI